MISLEKLVEIKGEKYHEHCLAPGLYQYTPVRGGSEVKYLKRHHEHPCWLSKEEVDKTVAYRPEDFTKAEGEVQYLLRAMGRKSEREPEQNQKSPEKKPRRSKWDQDYHYCPS